MKTVAFCALLAVMFPARAQTDVVPADTIALARSAAPPTNNLVQIAYGMGEIVTFNSTGFILKSNDAYLPRVALTNVAEPDFRALLESRTVYDALTLFRAGAPRTADSGYYETRLRVLWTNTPSLSARIRTRAAILDIMRAYNDSLAAYAGSVGFENNAAAIKKTAISSEYTDATASSNAAAKVGSAQNRHDEHEAWHDYRTANNNF